MCWTKRPTLAIFLFTSAIEYCGKLVLHHMISWRRCCGRRCAYRVRFFLFVIQWIFFFYTFFDFCSNSIVRDCIAMMRRRHMAKHNVEKRRNEKNQDDVEEKNADKQMECRTKENEGERTTSKEMDFFIQVIYCRFACCHLLEASRDRR